MCGPHAMTFQFFEPAAGQDDAAGGEPEALRGGLRRPHQGAGVLLQHLPRCPDVLSLTRHPTRSQPASLWLRH